MPGSLQGNPLPAHRFAPCGATIVFFYRGKKETNGEKKTPAPDTMLSPARLLRSLKPRGSYAFGYVSGRSLSSPHGALRKGVM